MTAVALPAPLVKFGRHPVRWFRIKTELVLDALVLAHVGMFIIVGLYYLLFEVNPAMTSWWHHAVSNSDLRHSIRDVAEGVLGGFLAQAIVWNHFKKRHQKTGRIYGVLHDRLHIPTTPAALLATVIFGAVGFTATYYLLHAIHVHAQAVGGGGSLATRTGRIWNADWDKKVMGYAAAFVARRPMHVLFDDAQGWFAERRVLLGKPLRFYHPPVFKARYNALAAGEANADRAAGAWVTGLMIGGLLAGVCLAGFGYYVLTYIAQGR